MDILAASVWLRYLEECGESLVFPNNGYRGEYVRSVAFDLHKAHGERLRRPATEVFFGIPADEPQGGDKELHIDALVTRTKTLLGRSTTGACSMPVSKTSSPISVRISKNLASTTRRGFPSAR